jgi:hypothetical protein
VIRRTGPPRASQHEQRRNDREEKKDVIEIQTESQKVVGSNPSRHAIDYKGLTLILATQRKSVFATRLPLLRRKVGSGR